MKKQLFLLLSLFSIGSLHAMDDQDPEGKPFSPASPLIAISAASPLSTEGTPEVNGSRTGMSFLAALDEFNTIARQPLEELPEDIVSSTSAPKSKKPKTPRGRTSEFTRNRLNRYGFHKVSNKIFSTDNATAAVGLAKKTNNSAQKARLLAQAAQSSQKTSKNRKKALLEVFGLLSSLRIKNYPQMLLVQQQFNKPLNRRSCKDGDYTKGLLHDKDLNALWLKNMEYFKIMQKPRKSIHEFLKQIADPRYTKLNEIIKIRIKLMSDTLRVLKKSKSLATVDRLFCELQDSELNALIKGITETIPEQDALDKSGYNRTEQDKINAKRWSLTLCYEFHNELSKLVKLLHTKQEEVQKLGSKLTKLKNKKRADISTNDKLIYKKGLKSYNGIKAFNKLLFTGIRQSFLIVKPLKPVQEQLRQLEGKFRQLDTQRLQSSGEEETALITQIATLKAKMAPVAYEVAQKESWLRFITTIFTDSSTTHAAMSKKIGDFIKVVSPVLATEQSIRKLSNKIKQQELQSEFAIDPRKTTTPRLASRGGFTEQIEQLQTARKALLETVATQKAAVTAFIASSQPTSEIPPLNNASTNGSH